MELDQLKENASLQDLQTAKDCAPTKHGFVRLYAVDLASSWHKSSSINWHHIKPKYLPPYSPDFNPIEFFWLCLKKDFLTSWFAKKADALLDRTVAALRSFIGNPAAITSITNH